MNGVFDRDALPTASEYIQQHALSVPAREIRALQGKGWITTECRIHGGSDSCRWNLATGGWMCMACGEHGPDALDYHRKAYGLSFVEAARDLGAWVEEGQTVPAAPARKPQAVRKLEQADSVQYPVLADFGRKLLAACVPLAGTDGEKYLQARRCALPPQGSHLRFHPALEHPAGYTGPALVALVTDAASRAWKTLHRTWIRADGTKAEVQPPRLLLGGHSKKGGVVRLWPDDYVTHGLAVAEGIETALSLAHGYCPVWACLDAGNLGTFPVLPGIESLLFGADNDVAGAKGAESCAARWWAAGVEVRITQQPQNDLNDVLAEEVA